MTCPVCEDGEGVVSGWEVVKEIRTALGMTGQATNGELREAVSSLIWLAAIRDRQHRRLGCSVCLVTSDRAYVLDALEHADGCSVGRALALLKRGDQQPAGVAS
jgi:hypothetical protein